MLKRGLAAALAAIGLLAPAGQAPGGEYLSDLLKKPTYRAAWKALLKTRKVDAWLAQYAKTYDGPAAVCKSIKVDGVAYTTGWVCKAHECGGNTFNVIFAPKGKQAWGLWTKGGHPTILAKPNAAQRAALEKLANS